VVLCSSGSIVGDYSKSALYLNNKTSSRFEEPDRALEPTSTRGRQATRCLVRLDGQASGARRLAERSHVYPFGCSLSGISHRHTEVERRSYSLHATPVFYWISKTVVVPMSVHIVRLGSPRLPSEGVRLGTVRRPPRGVPKTQFSTQNWYDIWFPNLAPSLETMKLGLSAASEGSWSKFAKRYKAEMAAPHAKHDLELLAVLSRSTNFSVGCYCEHEHRCHRSILRQLLVEAGADVA
jgi:uncharacterized protein YeaO (DUF488 family)